MGRAFSFIAFRRPTDRRTQPGHPPTAGGFRNVVHPLEQREEHKTFYFAIAFRLDRRHPRVL